MGSMWWTRLGRPERFVTIQRGQRTIVAITIAPPIAPPDGGEYRYMPSVRANMESVHLLTLGCPKNVVDSELMLGALSRAGYALTLDPSEAGVLVVDQKRTP